MRDVRRSLRPTAAKAERRSPGNARAAGRYRVKQRLGGGMGAVFLVKNADLQREEALKVPHFEMGGDPAIRERFLREARAAARLEHPNLCPIYHADVIDGIYFLTMRYLKRLDFLLPRRWRMEPVW